MSRNSDKYAAYAEHPRYGRRPNITGLNPDPLDRGIILHWRDADSHTDGDQPRRIPNTAIVADLDRQTPATMPVTHYFDLERRCRDCRQWFIFFAEEQKLWYEALGFPLESDCVRCVECRRRQRGIARQREVYEELFHVSDRTIEQSLEMADACLSLIEAGIFTTKQAPRVRMLLNAIPDDADVRKHSRFDKLVERVVAVEIRTTS